ncbi:MAG TPA: universal stress protein [Longimicrobium sp.]|nr:universal stress protein [Longimicrobium sp.]
MSTPLRTLVAGVATLSPRDPVLLPALRLAERTGAALYLVHAYTPNPAVLAGADPARLYDDALQARLQGEAYALSRDARVFCRAHAGRPEEVLTRVAMEVGADALLLARTRRGPLAGALLGTTAEHVLRHATVPVLVLHGEPAFHRVLLTTDLSAHSVPAHERGLALGCALASTRHPSLRTLHVVPPASLEQTVDGADDDVNAAIRELATFLPDHAVEGNVPAACVRFGVPDEAIVHEARAWSADLLVLGTHGRRGAARFLLGSVAATVLRHAPCSVLVVPPVRAGAAGSTVQVGEMAIVRESEPVHEAAPAS